jgi:alkylation response protein AidB-like acyl-CoA dehydrogenase
MMSDVDKIENLISRGADYARKLTREQTWRDYLESGVLGLSMPTSLGGHGFDLSSLIAFFEGLGYGGGDAGVLFALAAQIWSVQYPIIKFGTEEQRRTFLPGLISGELRAAHAATELDSGSDVFNIQTVAIPFAGGYRLSGRKYYITSAPVADLALVLASTQQERHQWGLTAFLVNLDSDGVWRSENIPKLGLQSAEIGEIRFQDCFVPNDRRLGSEGYGMTIFKYAIDLERSFILAPVIGLMRRQLEQTVSEANGRRRYGRSIGSFQSISNRIADMNLRLELSKLAIYSIAMLKEAGHSTKHLSAVVKLAVSEFYLASSLDAMRVAGASGYLLNNPAGVSLCDALGGIFYSGTSDILRNIIAHYAGVRND